MGLSGLTGMTSFTNTFLYSFLDTFCFPGNTLINIKGKGPVPIKDVVIGDIILPNNSRVTATFQFHSKGQPMVQLGSITVSTNHYVVYKGQTIKAEKHPEAIKIENWSSDEPLYCLNTNDNHIFIDGYEFLDYDETKNGDVETMNFIENRINASNLTRHYNFTEYSPAVSEQTTIKTVGGLKQVRDIKIGDKLVTGSTVIGLIRKEVSEVCILEDNSIITPSTLYWNSDNNKWERFGNKYKTINQSQELVSFIVVPNSQIELGNGIRIRDYMELCSPDSEMYYSKHLE
jgi:hypothetical protein